MADDDKTKLITRLKLSDQVFDKLWQMIADGDLSPGDFMPSERSLMERFGVGRPAVREALQSLANKGVITISHGERSRVNELSASNALHQIEDIAKLLLSSEPDNIEHLKNARKLLEYGIARLAAPRCTSADAADLRALIDKQRKCVNDSERFIEMDIAFHMRIAEIAGNPILLAVSKATLTWLFEYYRPLLYWEGREVTTLIEHSHVVDALEMQDEEAAVAAMRQHLNRLDAA
ncbi:transcriptional regulator NanR [Loktanella sp. S4079]|uniref:transcriptional regulator NanR n=1 Tax=Loktanella sp. S4079 TaxID=579483 RepID=UPI0005FA71EB|nr:transcriptional regulator NanR [Loktanella sp. S4079]KJZ18456.1 GntR family transcriptional regulator [Loktanella sp. S4079]